MAEIILNAVCRSDAIATRLVTGGVAATVRSSGGTITSGGHVADRHVIVVSEEQRAAAQAILDAFDPAQAQAEVEAEETAEKTRAEKLRALAEWLRTQSKDVREKFADIQSAMESGRSEIAENRQHIKYIEQFISAKYPAAFKPQQWSQTGAAGETGDGQRND